VVHSSVANRSEAPVIIVESNARSHNTDPQYCLLSEEWTAVRKPTTNFSILGFGGRFEGFVGHFEGCVCGPYLRHCRLEVQLDAFLTLALDAGEWSA
jgi:hypothetical protein